MRITKLSVELWLEKKVVSEKYGLSFYDKVGDKPLEGCYFEHSENEAVDEDAQKEIESNYFTCFADLCEKYANKVVGDYKFVIERKCEIVETNYEAEDFLEEE